MLEKLPFAKVDQIGIIVKDLDKAIKYYESLGFGPFVLRKPDYHFREQMGKTVPADVTLIKIALAQAGPIQLELIEPVAEGHSMEFLKKKGEGINHLGVFVDDFEREEAKLLKKGLKRIYRSATNRPDGSFGHASFFDTSEVGGIMFELIQRPLK